MGWRLDLHNRLIEEFGLPKNRQCIDAPTSRAWIIGQTKTNGPHDCDAVHETQAGFKIPPLSDWGREPRPVAVKCGLSVDLQMLPPEQVKTSRPASSSPTASTGSPS
jgi:hypothetical protein